MKDHLKPINLGSGPSLEGPGTKAHLLFASSAIAGTFLLHATHLGLCPIDLRRRSGIAETQLLDHQARIPAEQMQLLLEACERASGNPGFGCDLVKGIATHCLQGLNILLDSAPDLGSSLSAFCEHQTSLTNCMETRLEVEGDMARLVLQLAVDGVHYFGLDAAVLALIRNTARRIGEPAMSLFTEVGIAPSQRCGEVLSEWGIAWCFASSPYLLLHKRLLSTPLRGANEFLYQRMRHELSGVQELGKGDGLHLASFWLRSSDLPIERIAERIGYQQSNNFIRAFRKRFGVTPRRFRVSKFK